MEAVLQPAKVSASHCKRHQKVSMEVAQGNQASNQAAKRAALQNTDLIEVATLVPQTNLPETPSYTEGETLKAKREGFEEDLMEWFQRIGYSLQYSGLENSMDYSPWGHKESDTTEGVSVTLPIRTRIPADPSLTLKASFKYSHFGS